MVGWDVYCALCSTETGVDDERVPASRDRVMLAIRHRVMLALKARVERGEVTHPYADFYDEGARKLDDSEIHWDWDDESCAYDPTLLGEDDVEWQGDVRCFGLNVKTNRAFLSGPARNTDSGHVSVTRGSDPNEPIWDDGDEPLTYWTLDEGDPVLFPTHKACRRILEGVLGATAAPDVNKKALYEAMCLLSTMFKARLTIDYGNFRGNKTYWGCIPGEEYVAMQPEISPDAMAAIRSKISSGALRYRQYSPPAAGPHSVSDPLGSLPSELVCQVASYLCIIDLKAMLAASPHVMKATDGDVFWRGVLRRDMGWMGRDLDALLLGRGRHGADGVGGVDSKALFLYLEKMTRPAFAVDAPWLGAANRRRIWGACEQVADVYWERKRQGEKMLA